MSVSSVGPPSPRERQAATLQQSFSVHYRYAVHFTECLFADDNDLLARVLCAAAPERRNRFIVFYDDGLEAAIPGLAGDIEAYAGRHAERIELVAAPMAMPGGERIKAGYEHFERMQRALFDNHIDRHSYVVGIGGGALLDAAGLAAATAHRGVRHVRVPTTVLAQNDSGVGVKNGVNRYGAKNFTGTFAPPFAVINDMAFIDVLPARDKIAGMAEAVKVALIRDMDFYRWLEARAEALAAFEPDALSYLIRRCAELHMHQIAHGGDPFEAGSARPLDYGHWAAHKLEAMTAHELRHGEAVAIGMALDTRYAVAAGMLAEGNDERVCRLLERLGFELWHPALEARDGDGRYTVLGGLRDFQEHLGGDLTVTLLRELGVGFEVHEMDYGLIDKAIAWLKRRRLTAC